MSFLSDLLPQDEPKVPMDDNAAQTSAAENPYLSIAVPQVQAAFDTMYAAVQYLVEGKSASIKQIDKWLSKWESKLEWIVKKYQELLGKFNEMSGSLSAALTLDIAKEAWEILQDFPILRRYLGEANYWLLYDTIGLAATQGASAAGDLASAVKEALKAGIKALLAMTDGMMSIESYLGMISQYWGALYIKIIPLPLLDSIVPNVTCTYFFKPEVQSDSPWVNNPVPGPGGFIPIPIPIPNPEFVAKFPLKSLAMDYNDPDTWVDTESGMPKFLNNDALLDALEYWGSSYTNETLPGITSANPGIPAVYKRRDYIRDAEKGSEAHPLRIGNTFAQLDTSKTIVAYGGSNGDDEGNDNAKALAQFQALWQNEGFVEAMREWQTTWDTARQQLVEFMKSTLDGFAPKLDSDGNVVLTNGTASLGPFTSMKQLNEYSGDARQKAYERLMGAMFTKYSMGQGLYDLSQRTWEIVDPLLDATRKLIHRYLKASGQPTSMEGMPVNKYRLYKSYELAALLAKAAIAMRRMVPQTSKFLSNVDAIPLFGKCWCNADGNIPWSSGVSQFVRILPTSQIPTKPLSEGVQPPEGWPEGLREYSIDNTDPSWGVTSDPKTVWASIPTFEDDDPAGSWGAWAYSLVRPSTAHPMPYMFLKFDDGEVIKYAEGDELKDEQVRIGTIEDGALSRPSAWNQATPGSTANMQMTCGFFIADDINEAPTTVVGALLTMLDEIDTQNSSLEEEVADEVGYSVLKGRRPLAACFGIYGKLLGMKGWCFKAMPAVIPPSTSPTYNAEVPVAEAFASKYTRIPGSDLWYETEHPDKIVYKHSSFYSPSMGMAYTIYHEYMAHETHDRGSEHYDFYVFPTESVSVQEIKDGTLGALRSVDATGSDGRRWHFITMKNAVPKCPKYVEADRWSIIDLIHELYLLAWGMSPFCGDNGARLAKLEDVLKQFGVSPPQFIGQLPGDGEDVAANFQIGLFEEYATRIERLVSSIYKLRDEILAATEAW